MNHPFHHPNSRLVPTSGVTVKYSNFPEQKTTLAQLDFARTTEDLLIECAACGSTETFGRFYPGLERAWDTQPHRVLKFLNKHQKECHGVEGPLPKSSPFVLRH